VKTIMQHKRVRRVVGLGVMGLLALAGCNLGAAPVTYELVDADNFNQPLGPSGVASGDLEGDGDLDLVVTGDDGYGVLTNDGSGAYSLDIPDSYAPQTSPSLVDVDGDDDVDLVSYLDPTSSPERRVPAVNRNDGSGTFGPPEVVESTPPPGELSAVVPSDADSDGDIDLLGAFRTSDGRHVGVYLNDGTGTFAPPTTYRLGFPAAVGATPVRLVTGDLDGDGDDDVVATDVGAFTTPSGEVVDGTVAAVSLNDGTGAFAASGSSIEVSWTGAVWALHPALADLDGDGRLDLAVGGPRSVTTLAGDGAGGFSSPQRTEVPDTRGIDFVTPADIDDDGNVDLVGFDDILSPRAGIVAYGDGAGGIDTSHEVASGTDLGSDGTPGTDVEIADIEGDGDSDILFLAGSLGVVENAIDGRPAH
jgi:hypothetical protein